MQIDNADLLSEVAEYYTKKLHEHGDTPLGVDWNGEENQILRFKQLSKVICKRDSFTLNDLGCGYGALYSFLASNFKNFKYSGIDISEEMVRAAKRRHVGIQRAKFLLSSKPDQVADYGVASGIFNVRQSRAESEWRAYVEATLDVLDQTSYLGFAFNCLTSYSDPEKMRENLYYANPGDLFDLCMHRYSRNVALLHDYGLYEFTILVRKIQ